MAEQTEGHPAGRAALLDADILARLGTFAEHVKALKTGMRVRIDGKAGTIKIL